jgi:hypothetical protein
MVRMEKFYWEPDSEDRMGVERLYLQKMGANLVKD